MAVAFDGLIRETLRSSMYGIPSHDVAADSSKDTKVELQKNVDIAKNDSSTIRNLDTWRGGGSPCRFGVVITTHNGQRT